MELRPLVDGDRPVVVAAWGDAVARRGELIEVGSLPGFAAVVDGEVVGTVTYSVVGTECEIVTLAVSRRRCGIGRALVAAVAESARRAGCHGLWLVTTNDNTGACAFYGATGFALVALRPGVVDVARRTLKPAIPELGHDGVPIRDELEYRRCL